MIYVVLGMHKSGTTLIAEMLHRAGINMGDFNERVEYDFGHKFERKETRDLNESIIGCVGYFSLNVIKPLKSCAFLSMFIPRMSHLIEELDLNYDVWGFKDPRTCLTYEAWLPHLTKHHIIFVYRSPLEVWLHYERQAFRLNIIRRIKNGWNSIIAWYIYNIQALKYLDQCENEFIIIDYNELMRDNAELVRLERFLGMKLDDRRRGILYRHRAEGRILYMVMVWVQKTFFSRNVENLYNEIKKRRLTNCHKQGK